MMSLAGKWITSLSVSTLLGVSALSAVASSSPKDSTNKQLRSSVDAAVREEISKGFSGAVLVARGKTIILDQAYGSIKDVEMTPDTRFWIASAAKQFTSTAILKCEERGWLRLDDPISRFIPDAPPDKQNITIRQLLAHLSGFGQSYVSEGQSERQTAVRRMLDEPLTNRPGNRFQYANNNYQMAVAIVELASGSSYKEFVRKHLWKVAGLRHSGFAGDDQSALVAPARAGTPVRLAKATWGGEGVYSTSNDLWRWYRALRNGKFLSPASVEKLFTGVAPTGEGQTALGWFIGKTEKQRQRIFTRGNDDFGPNALIYAYPQSDTVIIVLSHAGQANDDLSWSRTVHAKIEKLLGL